MQSPKFVRASKLRAARNRKGMSGPQLAARLGIRKHNISNWERGVYNPSASNLMRLCQVLECEPGDIMGADTAD